MRRQSLLGFVILNIAVTFIVTLGIIIGYTRLVPTPTPRQSPPLFVVVSTTPDPNLTPASIYVVVTATPAGIGAAQLTNPAIGTIPTLDPSLAALVSLTLPSTAAAALATDNSTATPNVSPTDKSGCPTYTIRSGDVPGAIATRFNIALADLYKANHLKIDPVLQIGQVLIIPTDSCGLSTDTPTLTPSITSEPTVPPTSTPASTAANATIEIAQVIKPGDITEEGVELHNTGDAVVEMKSWTLSDGQGNKFTFPTYRMFPNARVLINTRTGSNTPRVLYWGKSQPLWGNNGTLITLTDDKNTVQATFTVGSDGSNSVQPTAASGQ